MMGQQPRVESQFYYFRLEEPNSGRSPVAVDRSLRRFPLHTGAADAVIRREGASFGNSSVMNPRRMPTTARKENRCAIAVCSAAVEVTPIARQQGSAKGVHRKNSVSRQLI